MESRLLLLLLSLSFSLSLFCTVASAQDEEENYEDQTIIDPDVDRRKIKRPKIDSENFEVGLYTGFMSVEDFGVNPVFGAPLCVPHHRRLFCRSKLRYDGD